MLDGEELINDIYKYKKLYCKGFNMIDTILEYCNKYDYNIQEVGNILSENEFFVRILNEHLISEKYIKSNAPQEGLIEQEEW